MANDLSVNSALSTFMASALAIAWLTKNALLDFSPNQNLELNYWQRLVKYKSSSSQVLNKVLLFIPFSPK